MSVVSIATHPGYSRSTASSGTPFIDLFSGLGGGTEGASQAGAKPVLAANHWDYAVAVHKANHPEADHLLQDLHLADWTQLPDHSLAIAGPSCKGFTKARGKERAHHDHLRASMWNVVSCAEVHRQEVWVVENVTEVLKWALFPAWKMAMTALGYSIEIHTLNAMDFGCAQDRERVFIVCTRTKSPIGLDLSAWKQAPVAASTVIDWNYKRWSKIRKTNKAGELCRSPKVLAQIKRARRELKTDRFLIPYYGSGSGLTGRCLSRPIGTIVAQDIWAVVDGDRMRMIQPHEARRFMGFPDDYKLIGKRRDKMRALGNAICPPVMRALVEAIAQQTALIKLAA